MKKMKRMLALLLAACMLLGLLCACDSGEKPSDGSDAPDASGTPVIVDEEYPITPEELGSGEVKWSEEKTADGWMRVTNDGGETLGYSPDSGVKLIQVGGYAFKDLNKNGKLDLYEDWRQEDGARAADLATQMGAEDIFPLMMHPIFFSAVLSDLTPQLDNGVRFALSYLMSSTAADQAQINNEMQAYVEGKALGIPLTISTDPRDTNSSDAPTLPKYSGLGASFNTEFVSELSKTISELYRSVGITMVLGPNTDTQTDPRGQRNQNSFSEDPALVRDMVDAVISAYQSTFDESGNDLGWGSGSVNCVTKHWPGDGIGEGGREGHSSQGRNGVYPGGQFSTSLIAFVDGALDLTSSTKSAAGVMPSYTIAWSDTEEYGELVGSAYSEYKMDLLRSYDFTGAVISDWDITKDVDNNGKSYGVEDLSVAERAYAAIKNGIDQLGGVDDVSQIKEAYELFVEDEGEEAALAHFQSSAARLMKLAFQTGLFENAYVSTAYATELATGRDALDLVNRAQLNSVVMLKNENGAIQAETRNAEEKKTVYVPYVYRTAQPGSFQTTPASAFLPVNIELLEEYFNVITDSLSDTLTGPADESGNPTVAYEDIIRASTDDLAVCDYVLVFVDSPIQNTFGNSGGGYDGEKYLPKTLQYGEYVANSNSVRQESIGKMFEKQTVQNIYASADVTVEVNTSYYGNTGVITNATDLDTILYAASEVPEGAKVIVAITATNATVVSEFEKKADAILFGYTTDDRAFLEVISGKSEPSGVLNWQMPANMEAVEAQYEDVPRDMECYVDSAGNTYDFGFGLNWSGVIQDERTEKYCVPPLTEPAAQPVG